MRKIGKYEFKDEATADSKIKGLGVATDEDGNEYKTPAIKPLIMTSIVYKKSALIINS